MPSQYTEDFKNKNTAQCCRSVIDSDHFPTVLKDKGQVNVLGKRLGVPVGVELIFTCHIPLNTFTVFLGSMREVTNIRGRRKIDSTSLAILTRPTP